MAVPGHLSSLLRAAELREVCYRAKAAAYLREMISEVDACNRYDAAKSGAGHRTMEGLAAVPGLPPASLVAWFSALTT